MDSSGNSVNLRNQLNRMNYNEVQYLVPYHVWLELPIVIDKYGINTKERLAHFLAQCSHESANFTYTRENLNYDVDGLLRVFPKYFDAETARRCARRPQLIASKVYANRMGNGDEASGDGWLYRGAGYMQLTGKDNFRKYGEYLGVDLVSMPGLVDTKYPLDSAAWFFLENKIFDICDQGLDNSIIIKVSKKVNLGNENAKAQPNGLIDRVKQFNKFSEAIDE